MKTFAPINVIVHYPTTEEGWRELRRRVAGVHADGVLNSISKLDCPIREKERLLIKAVMITCFKIYVCATSNANNLCHFLLHKTKLMSAKSQAVGDVINIFIRMVLLVK